MDEYELDNKLEEIMAVYSILPDEEKEKINEYMKFVLYFKDLSNHMHDLGVIDVEDGESFAVINKHLRAIIKVFKKMEDLKK